MVVDPFDPRGVKTSSVFICNQKCNSSKNSDESLNLNKSNNDLDENESCFEV